MHSREHLPILVFLVNANRAARRWAVGTGPTRGRWALMESETCMPVACWRSFWRALAVLLLFLLAQKEQIQVLSSSPRVTAGLLVSPPCSWHCAGRHSKSSRRITYGCAGYRLMLLVVTGTLAEHKTKEELVRKDKERAAVCVHHMWNHFPFLGLCCFCLHCTCCHFHLHQSSGIDSQSLVLPIGTECLTHVIKHGVFVPVIHCLHCKPP